MAFTSEVSSDDVVNINRIAQAVSFLRRGQGRACCIRGTILADAVASAIVLLGDKEFKMLAKRLKQECIDL